MIRVAIIGATGYTGLEAIEIILRHPEAEVTYLTRQVDTPGPISDIFPKLKGRCDIDIEPLDVKKLSEVADVALCCLPHKVSMSVVPSLLDAGVKVVDLSADYRIKDVGTYEKFYQPHTDQKNLASAAYGLPELFRKQIKGASLVANPGCFPTGASLATAPLLKNKLIKTDSIIINSVSGITGAGKTPSDNFHFPNMNENMFAYGIGVHRHMPEMEQVASQMAGEDVTLLFQPHVGPFDRGILSTVYSEPAKELTQQGLLELYTNFYKDEYFVKVLETAPKLKDVTGTNHCQIFPTIAKDRVICFATIDNLTKGSSGGAVQNMNIMFGIDETLGLR